MQAFWSVGETRNALHNDDDNFIKTNDNKIAIVISFQRASRVLLWDTSGQQNCESRKCAIYWYFRLLSVS